MLFLFAFFFFFFSLVRFSILSGLHCYLVCKLFFCHFGAASRMDFRRFNISCTSILKCVDSYRTQFWRLSIVLDEPQSYPTQVR
jgi:hypothetical protein